MNVIEKHPNIFDPIRQSNIITSSGSDLDALKIMLVDVENNMNEKLEELRKLIEELRNSKPSNTFEPIDGNWDHLVISFERLNPTQYMVVNVYLKKVERDTQLITFSSTNFGAYLISESNYNFIQGIYDDVVINHHDLLVKHVKPPFYGVVHTLGYSIFCEPNHLHLLAARLGGSYLFQENKTLNDTSGMDDVRKIVDIMNTGTKINLNPNNPTYTLKKGSFVMIAKYHERVRINDTIEVPNIQYIG